ncbi:DUF1499 domain-containing protein [Aureimonas sp. Leaf454]|uniref:DUF1499 domain-containing protein n=1 Tax=Aureimonas sp. Leaf454 TaxID=1736381 RepID=UPI00138EE9D8|nr:DUF1499 domain-containing protein [Aureimonas sp. Leaf454]
MTALLGEVAKGEAAAGGMKATGHYIRKRLRLAGAARSLAGFSLVFLAAGIVAYRLDVVDFEALKGVLVVAFAMAAAALVIALVGLARVWRSGYQGGGVAIGAVALSLLTLAPFVLAGILAYDNPGVAQSSSEGMQAAEIGAPVEPAEASPDAPPPITGRRYQATAAQVFGVTRLVLADLGWEVSTVNAAAPLDEEDGDLGVSGTVDVPIPTPRDTEGAQAQVDPLDQPDSTDYAIEATATGPVLALPSDITIRIVEDGSESFVDLRSASRSVAWDLGQNRRFIEDFLTRLDLAMAGALTVVPAGEG